MKTRQLKKKLDFGILLRFFTAMGSNEVKLEIMSKSCDITPELTGLIFIQKVTNSFSTKECAHDEEENGAEPNFPQQPKICLT